MSLRTGLTRASAHTIEQLAELMKCPSPIPLKKKNGEDRPITKEMWVNAILDFLPTVTPYFEA